MSDSPKMKPDIKGAYEAALGLLGEEVEVYIGEDPDTEEQVLVVGKLLSFGDDGGIITQDEMGFVSWSWPMLNIRERTES